MVNLKTVDLKDEFEVLLTKLKGTPVRICTRVWVHTECWYLSTNFANTTCDSGEICFSKFKLKLV